MSARLHLAGTRLPSDTPAVDRSRLRRYYDDNAGVYDRWMVSYDRFMLGGLRHDLCGLARGRTLELAVGTGLNLDAYPAGLELVGADYSTKMLEGARRRAQSSATAVALLQGDAAHLPFPDGTFDTVLTTLFLSSAPNLPVTVAEVSRVLRPGGRLLVLDHGRSDLALVRLVERTVSSVLEASTGVDLRRDPEDYLDAQQFLLERVERSRLGIVHLVVARRQ